MNKPFSKRLNHWIKERIKNVSYTLTGGNYSYREIKKSYWINYELLINDDYCDNTIYGSRQQNINFRVWHDLVHLQNNLDFSFKNECEVAFLQCSELPDDWNYEKMLIISEVIGQGLYFEKYNKFVDNQINFTNELLKNGKI